MARSRTRATFAPWVCLRWGQLRRAYQHRITCAAKRVFKRAVTQCRPSRPGSAKNWALPMSPP